MTLNELFCDLNLTSASLLQTSESRDPSDIILICWFAAQETFLIMINVKKNYVLSEQKHTYDEHDNDTRSKFITVK